MYLTQQHQQQDLDEADGHQSVIGYDDPAALAQQQLIRKLRKATSTAQPNPTTPAAAKLDSRQQANTGSAAGQQLTLPRSQRLPSAVLVEQEHLQQHSPPASRDAHPHVHDLLDDLLTQAQTAAVAVGQQQQQQQHHAAANRHMQHASQGARQGGPDVSVQGQLQQSQQQVPAKAAAVLKSNRQLLANLLQPAAQQQYQQQQVPPAAAGQPPTAPASVKQQQRQRSVLYSAAPRSSHSTPGGRTSSTPHQKAATTAAAKKKPRFSIKDTPPQPTPSALVTPQAKGQRSAAPAAAGAASGGSRSLASLLGSSTAAAAAAAATPNRQAAGDSSRTPVKAAAVTPAGLFATPRHSSSKLHTQAKTGATPLPAGAQHHTPGPAAADAAAAAVGPAALFADDDQAAATPAAAAAAAAAAGGGGGVTPQAAGTGGGSSSGRGTKRRAADVNPLELMSASRQRQRAFLDSLPAGLAAAAAAGGGGVGPGLQLAGVSVPLGSSLSKVWQQLADARKRQQDRLEEHPESDAGALELEVVSKSWEAHLVKCCCTVRQCPPPAATTQATQATQRQPQAGSSTQAAAAVAARQQQPQPRVGDRVFVLINSKAGHSVELQQGSRVRLHTPWHVMAPSQPDKPMVLLGHFMS